MTFAQRRNCLTTLVSERIAVGKRRQTVFAPENGFCDYLYGTNSSIRTVNKAKVDKVGTESGVCDDSWCKVRGCKNGAERERERESLE